MNNKADRTLTDADVDALSAALEQRMVNRFYLNAGKGLWGLAWKAILLILAWLALNGAHDRWFK